MNSPRKSSNIDTQGLKFEYESGDISRNNSPLHCSWPNCGHTFGDESQLREHMSSHRETSRAVIRSKLDKGECWDAHNVPAVLRCPISNLLMKDAVIHAKTGHTYDRSSIIPLLPRITSAALKEYQKTNSNDSNINTLLSESEIEESEAHVVKLANTLLPNLVIQRIVADWCSVVGMEVPTESQKPPIVQDVISFGRRVSSVDHGLEDTDSEEDFVQPASSIPVTPKPCYAIKTSPEVAQRRKHASRKEVVLDSSESSDVNVEEDVDDDEEGPESESSDNSKDESDEEEFDVSDMKRHISNGRKVGKKNRIELSNRSLVPGSRKKRKPNISTLSLTSKQLADYFEVPISLVVHYDINGQVNTQESPAIQKELKKVKKEEEKYRKTSKNVKTVNGQKLREANRSSASSKSLRRNTKRNGKENKEEADNDDDDIYMVERILDMRILDNKKEYLVKWEGWPDQTWEPVEHMLCVAMVEDFEESLKKSKHTSSASQNPPVAPKPQAMRKKKPPLEHNIHTLLQAKSKLQDALRMKRVSMAVTVMKSVYQHSFVDQLEELKQTRIDSFLRRELRPWVEQLRDHHEVTRSEGEEQGLVALSDVIRDTLDHWMHLNPLSPTSNGNSGSGGKRQRMSSSKSPHEDPFTLKPSPSLPPPRAPSPAFRPSQLNRIERSKSNQSIIGNDSNEIQKVTEISTVMEVPFAEEASCTGHLDWVRAQLTGDRGTNLFHIKKRSGCKVNLKKSASGTTDEVTSSSLHFSIRASDQSTMHAGIALIQDLIDTVSENYHQMLLASNSDM